MADEAPEVCALCGQGENALGHLRHTRDPAILAHYNCLIYSPQVALEPVEDSQDYLSQFNILSVRKEIARGKKLRCSHCRRSGATIGCHVKECRRNYHYPCAILTKGELNQKKYKFFCFEHAGGKSGTQNAQINNPTETSVAMDLSSRTQTNLPQENRKRTNKTCSKERKKRKTNCEIVQNTEMGNELRSDLQNSDQLFGLMEIEEMELPAPSTSTFTAQQYIPITIDSNTESDEDLPIFNGSQILQMKKEIKTDDTFVQMSAEELEEEPCAEAYEMDIDEYPLDELYVPENLINESWSKPLASSSPSRCIESEETQSANHTRLQLETSILEHAGYSTLVIRSIAEEHNYANKDKEKMMGSHFIGTSTEQISSAQLVDSNNNIDSRDTLNIQPREERSIKENPAIDSACAPLLTEAEPEHFFEDSSVGLQPLDSLNSNTKCVSNATEQDNVSGRHYCEPPRISDGNTHNAKSTLTKHYHTNFTKRHTKSTPVKKNPITVYGTLLTLTQSENDFEEPNTDLHHFDNINSNAKCVSNTIKQNNQNVRNYLEPSSISDAISTQSKRRLIDFNNSEQRFSTQSTEKSCVKENPNNQSVYQTLLTNVQSENEPCLDMQTLDNIISNTRPIPNPLEQNNHNRGHGFEPLRMPNNIFDAMSKQTKYYNVDINIGEHNKVHQNPKQTFYGEPLNLSNMIKLSNQDKELPKQPRLSTTAHGSVVAGSSSKHPKQLKISTTAHGSVVASSTIINQKQLRQPTTAHGSAAADSTIIHQKQLRQPTTAHGSVVASSTSTHQKQLRLPTTAHGSVFAGLTSIHPKQLGLSTTAHGSAAAGSTSIHPKQLGLSTTAHGSAVAGSTSIHPKQLKLLTTAHGSAAAGSTGVHPKQPRLSSTVHGSVAARSRSISPLAAPLLEASLVSPSTSEALNEQSVFFSSNDELSAERPLSSLIVSRTLHEQIEKSPMTSKTSSEQLMEEPVNSYELNQSNMFDEQFKHSSRRKNNQPRKLSLSLKSRKSVARTLDFSDAQESKDKCNVYPPLSSTETSLTGQSSHTSVVPDILEHEASRLMGPKNSMPVVETLLERTSSLRDEVPTVSSKSPEDQGVKKTLVENDPAAHTIHRKGCPRQISAKIRLNNDQKHQLLKSYSKTEKDLSDCNNRGTGSARAFWDLCLKYECQDYFLTLAKCSVESVMQKVASEEADDRDYEQAFTFLQASGRFEDLLTGEDSQKKKNSKKVKLAYAKQQPANRTQTMAPNEQEESYGVEVQDQLGMDNRSSDRLSPSASRNNTTLPEGSSVLKALQDLQTQQQSMLSFLLQHCLLQQQQHQQQQQDQDGDMAFATSLIPFLRQVPEDKKLATHMALEEKLLSVLGQNQGQQQTLLSAPSCHSSRQT